MKLIQRGLLTCFGVVCIAALSGCGAAATASDELNTVDELHTLEEGLEAAPSLAYECGAASILVHLTATTIGAKNDGTLDMDSYSTLEGEISKLWQAVYPLGSEISPTLLKIQEQSREGLTPELDPLLESVSLQCGEHGAPFQYSGHPGQG